MYVTLADAGYLVITALYFPCTQRLLNRLFFQSSDCKRVCDEDYLKNKRALTEMSTFLLRLKYAYRGY